jgi:hypothetical protein
MASDFLQTYTALANDIATRTGLDPTVVLGIIDTETGGGQRVKSNNIFGISPSGPQGQQVASYPDVVTASEAFISLMQTPRYAQVLAAGSPQAQVQELVRAGYNKVNPQYATLVASKAARFGQELGYQGQTPDGGGGGETKTAATAVDRVLADPALAAPATTEPPATAAAAPASKGSAVDRVLADPALSVTTTKDAGPPKPEIDKFGNVIGDPAALGGSWQAPATPTIPTIKDIREGLAPAPGYVPTPFFFSLKETTPGSGVADPKSGIAGMRPDWGPVRSVVNPLLDLLEGTGLSDQGDQSPLAGKVSPEATMLLLGSKLGPPVKSMRNPLAVDAAGRDIRFGPADSSEVGKVLDRDAKQFPGLDAAVSPAAQAVVAERAELQGRVRNALNEPTPEAPTSATGVSPVTRPQGTPPPVLHDAPPELSLADHQWAANMRDRLADLKAENATEGIPGDLGAAATPEELARLTARQMKAYRAQAELGEILAPPEPGLDKKIYVHGSEPTRAEYSGDPLESQKETLLRQRDPQRYEERLSKNNQARVDSYETLEGSKTSLETLRETKERAAERDGQAYLRVARPLDMTPQLSWIDQQMADPRVRESPARMRVLKQLRDSLYDETGKLKTDPRSGWGMHDEMIARLEKSKDPVTTDEKRAFKDLVEYKKIVDGVNDAASDGAFRKFLDNQTNLAQQINSMEVLQAFRSKLTNTQGKVNVAAFHKFVADLAERRGRPGADPAMGISDETMQGLINIDKDLKRTTNIDLGKARGSPTNLFFTLAKATGLGLAHTGTSIVSGGNPTANLFLQGAINQAQRVGGNVLLRRQVNHGLAPPEGGYDYNPLRPPNAPP